MPIKNDDINMDDFLYLHPSMIFAWSKVIEYCNHKRLRLCITSIFSDRKGAINRPPHSDFRAIDISIIGWSTQEIEDFAKFFNELFRDIGAISRSTMTPLFAFVESDHIHLQIKKGLSI